METSRTAEGITRRFIAGRTLADVLTVARKLTTQNILTTLDHLGENVATREEAQASCQTMVEALTRLSSDTPSATISIKLTQMGLDLGQELCSAHLRTLVEHAHRLSTAVEVDMESSEYTDRTLAIVERTHAEFPCLRAVLQAYLYRTRDDLQRLNEQRIPIRLCKGAYNEPATVAFPRKEEVDANYLKLTDLLMLAGTKPAIATHDPAMIDGALESARLYDRKPGDFEFQMLYGVRRDLQSRLVSDGWTLRLYVPYGDAWYPYFMRRLAERPANVIFLARNLLRA